MKAKGKSSGGAGAEGGGFPGAGIPSDFSSTVNDIKLAILQARAHAARLANREALKLYFYVGGYISAKTRKAKWGSGAIDALSQRLQVELPGLRGFSSGNIKKMRLFFEAWADAFQIRSLPTNELQMTKASHGMKANRSSTANDLRKDDAAVLDDESALFAEANRRTAATLEAEKITFKQTLYDLVTRR